MGERLFQNQIANAVDRSGFLGHAHDVGGREGLAIRPDQAQQGFKAQNPVCFQFENGLEVDIEPVFLERLLDVAFNLGLEAGIVQHGGVENVRAILAGALAGIHCHIGILQQFRRAFGMVRINGKADRGTEANILRLHQEGGIEQVHDARSQHFGPFARIRTADQDGKFIAAETGRDGATTQQAMKPVHELAQNRITGGMAQCVVDGLEAVEVDEQAGKFGFFAVRGLDGVGQRDFKALTIQETRQVIGDGLLAIALLGLAQFRNVHHHVQRRGGATAGGGQNGPGDEHIHGVPIRADKARGNIARLSRAFSASVGKTGTKQGAVGFLQKVREQLADHLFAGKAGGN